MTVEFGSGNGGEIEITEMLVSEEVKPEPVGPVVTVELPVGKGGTLDEPRDEVVTTPVPDE